MNYKRLPCNAYKLIAIALSIILSANLIFCLCPVKARAFDETDLVRDFWQIFNQNLGAIQQAISHDIQNGDYTASSDLAKQRLKQIGLQMMFKNYDPSMWNLSTDWNDTITVNSVGGATGFYISANDGLYHCVNVSGVSPYEPEYRETSSLSWTLCSSDEFFVNADLSIGSGDSPFIYQTSTSSSSFYSGARLYPSGVAQSYSGNLYSSGYFNFSSANQTGYISKLWHSYQCTVTSNAPIYLSKSAFNNFVNASDLNSAGFSVVVGGYGQITSLPDGEIDNNAPWVYYNDSLLPYIKQIVPQFDIDYFVFPDGYYPDTVPPSQQYPSGGGIPIGDQYYFDIDINFPTYPNGEPQTDESGETITETVIVTDTRPTDAVYNFTVPTLPGLQIDSRSIPLNTDLSSHTNPLLAMFGLITDIFDASGVLPVIPILFTMGIIFFVIYKCS